MTSPPPEPAAGVLAHPVTAHPPIEVLVALHDRDVRSALRRVLGRSQDEDDLVQEVFTRLVVRLRQPGELCVAAWLRGVAHNLAVDEIRRRRPVPVEEIRLDRAVASGADDAVAGADLYGRVVEGAYALPDRQRVALAAALGGAGAASVASHMGISVHAAESLLTRARVGLRNHLASADAEVGSARSSLAAVLAAVGVALGVVLRRWRTAATVTVASGALVAASFGPAVFGHDEVEGAGPSQLPTPVAAAPDGGDGTVAPSSSGEAGPDPLGDAGSAPTDDVAGPAAPPAASRPEEKLADAAILTDIADSLDVGLPGAHLRSDVGGGCTHVADVLDSLVPVERLAGGADLGALCEGP